MIPKIKTSELAGAALDWSVARCENFCLPYLTHSLYDWFKAHGPRYSTDWSQGGPIIEREEIGTKRNAPCSDDRQWEASPSITAKGAGGKWGYGPTPLIAAMRCFVASKLGDEVDVPDELL